MPECKHLLITDRHSSIRLNKLRQLCARPGCDYVDIGEPLVPEEEDE